MAKTPFEELREEHTALLNEAQDIQSTVRALSGGKEASLGVSEILGDELEMFRGQLRMHFRKEEECLFPEAQRMISEGAATGDLFGRFFGEEAEDDMSAHSALSRRTNEMLEVTDGIADSGGSQDKARKLMALVNLIVGLLERHAAKEETLIFPMLEKSLTTAQIETVRSRLDELVSQQELIEKSGPYEELRRLGGEG